MEKQKAKTSSAVKDRYNLKTYERYTLRIRKDSDLIERLATAVGAGSTQAFIVEAIREKLDRMDK